MQITKPLPDELHNGFIGRLMHVNGLTNLAAFKKSLLQKFPCNNGFSIETIAQAVRIPLGRYARHHTLMPFLHSVRSEHEAKFAHEDVMVWYGTSAHLARATPEVSFCADCVEEDLNFWGVSYWRRSHQLHGIVVCPKHGRALHRQLRPAILHLPQNFLGKVVEVKPAIVEQAQTNEFVRRYQEICLLLLERGSPLPVRTVRTHLAYRSTGLGLRLCETGNRPVLSDRIHAQAAGEWLWTNFWELRGHTKGHFHHSIDRMLECNYAVYPAPVYALGLASLFDSAHEAIRTISQAAPEGKLTFRRGATTSSPRPGQSSVSSHGIVPASLDR